MNLFWLDRCPRLAAEYHCDKHVVKMTLETAQILCSALDRLGVRGRPFYSPTHTNHPCVIWATTSADNWQRTLNLFIALGYEYEYRYDRAHASSSLLPELVCAMPYVLHGFPLEGDTPPPQVMPDRLRGADYVTSYRRYYREIKARDMVLTWKRRSPPAWVSADD